ncbi:MAG TPA: hypothetical protein VLD85_10255 [Anaeromyxobacteraceae bacterium]|nr:hypothetical protein [Anaeromyxobacteraceae bacterium]
MTKLAKFLAVAGLLAGCNDASRSAVPPLDRFHYPIGMALRHALDGCTSGPGCSTCQGGTPGCRTLLYVASSNFDLSYDPDTGGSLMAVDPDAAVHRQPLRSVGPPVLMGSFAGELALLDEASCPGWEDGTRQPLALVASRSLNLLYAMPLASDGAPSCGAGCTAPLAIGLGDPFGVTVTCRTGPGGAPEASAWIAYQSTPSATAWLTEVPLQQPLEPLAPVTLGAAPVYESVYDPLRDRLYLTSRFYSAAFTPIRHVDLGFPTATQDPIRLDLAVPGSEATGIAISSDGTRAYVALRLYEPGLAQFGRPPDIGGALAVLDLTDIPAGGPSGRLLRLVPLGLGPAEVRAVARPGMRDLVAVTCTAGPSLYLYDDELGAVARAIGLDESTGTPLLGRQPFGLAVESPWWKSAAAPSAVRFFVASFDQSFVSVVELDDPARPASADVLRVTDPASASCAAVCPTTPCAGSSCPPGCPAACLVPMRIGPERR